MTRVLVLLVVAMVSFGHVVAASSDPPDPTWIAGLWDNGDHDNAVNAVLLNSGWVSIADADRGPRPVTAPLALLALAQGSLRHPLAPLSDRAPPLAPKPVEESSAR